MEARLITDTTEIFSVEYGDILQLGGKSYRITGHEREARFGLDEPKFWVKKVQDLETGEKKIIKLSFLEEFETNIGEVKIRCFRNPLKEAQVLELVRDHPNFMQGTAHEDSQGNILRVLDIVPGMNFYRYIYSMNMPFETYFHSLLPDILMRLSRAFEGIRFIHDHGMKHGDVRNDHLIVERDSGNYVWIDFDYDYSAPENPFGLDLFGLGNILLHAVGKGIHTIQAILEDKATYGDLEDRIDPRDFSLMFKTRFINLQKLYPEIPIPLNDILMHFSIGANVFYEYTGEIIEDLNRCIFLMR
ncbi:MAG: protein kinase [Deltaproteobacteria bacterium]|nr:protein kinase [Deltaproteobacteria bacterium]